MSDFSEGVPAAGISRWFIKRAIKLPEDFRPSRSLFKLLLVYKTRHSLLTHAIRAKWSSMANLKRQITTVWSSRSLPCHILDKLDSQFLAQARVDRKRECTTSLIKKFDHLYDRQNGQHGSNDPRHQTASDKRMEKHHRRHRRPQSSEWYPLEGTELRITKPINLSIQFAFSSRYRPYQQVTLHTIPLKFCIGIIAYCLHPCQKRNAKSS